MKTFLAWTGAVAVFLAVMFITKFVIAAIVIVTIPTMFPDISERAAANVGALGQIIPVVLAGYVAYRAYKRLGRVPVTETTSSVQGN